MLKKLAKSFHNNELCQSLVQLRGILLAHICNDNFRVFNGCQLEVHLLKTIKLSYMIKRILTSLTLVITIMILGSVKNTASAQPGVGVSISYQSFYDELSPFGRWIEYPEYGYVWAPNMGHEFQPYSTGGQWVWSDEYDWMWVSDYSCGWAPFHYGR